jgi:hypothetical protein
MQNPVASLALQPSPPVSLNASSINTSIVHARSTSVSPVHHNDFAGSPVLAPQHPGQRLISSATLTPTHHVPVGPRPPWPPVSDNNAASSLGVVVRRNSGYPPRRSLLSALLGSASQVLPVASHFPCSSSTAHGLRLIPATTPSSATREAYTTEDRILMSSGQPPRRRSAVASVNAAAFQMKSVSSSTAIHTNHRQAMPSDHVPTPRVHQSLMSRNNTDDTASQDNVIIASTNERCCQLAPIHDPRPGTQTRRPELAPSDPHRACPTIRARPGDPVPVQSSLMTIHERARDYPLSAFMIRQAVDATAHAVSQQTDPPPFRPLLTANPVIAAVVSMFDVSASSASSHTDAPPTRAVSAVNTQSSIVAVDVSRVNSSAFPSSSYPHAPARNLSLSAFMIRQAADAAAYCYALTRKGAGNTGVHRSW